MAGAAASTLALLAWLLSRSHAGFDFTDEGFYLNWIANPWLYDRSVTQFGYVYHPLHLLADGDIPTLRQANILITFLLAWLLCLALLERHVVSARDAWPRDRGPTMLVAGTLASSALIVFTLWLPTPSYNSLALQALLLTATGVVLADGTPSRGEAAPWVLVGAGGWLAFMAKPPTAAALAVATVALLVVRGKASLRPLVVSAATATSLTLASAWAIDGSAPAFLERLKGGIETGHILNAGHDFRRLLRWDSFSLTDREGLLAALGAIVVLVATRFVASKSRRASAVGLLMCLVLAVSGVAIIGRMLVPALEPTIFVGMVIGGVAFGTFAGAIALAGARPFRLFAGNSALLALYLGVMPYAYAFGTGNNYWQQGASAGVFWVLAGAALLSPAVPDRASWRCFLPTAVSAQLVTILLLAVAMEHPYRQPQALRLDRHAIEIGTSRSRLLLSREVADYFERASALARAAGFAHEGSMIDLTGHSPGTLFGLGATAIGRPWIIGGYPGSERLAALTLDRVSCERLAAAWLLVEPSGPRRLDPAILLAHGIDPQRDFVEVGALTTPRGTRGYQEAYEQRILKPVRSELEATAACRAARHPAGANRRAEE